MDEGWGLALEKSDQVGFFGSKSIFGFNLSPRLTNKNKGLIMFPVNSSGKEEHEEMPTGSQQKAVLGEVDFFLVKSKPVNDVNATMKKEVPHVEASTRSESDVNTGFQSRFQLFRRVFPVCLRQANLSRPTATSFDRLLEDLHIQLLALQPHGIPHLNLFIMLLLLLFSKEALVDPCLETLGQP